MARRAISSNAKWTKEDSLRLQTRWNEMEAATGMSAQSIARQLRSEFPGRTSNALASRRYALLAKPHLLEEEPASEKAKPNDVDKFINAIMNEVVKFVELVCDNIVTQKEKVDKENMELRETNRKLEAQINERAYEGKDSFRQALVKIAMSGGGEKNA